MCSCCSSLIGCCAASHINSHMASPKHIANQEEYQRLNKHKQDSQLRALLKSFKEEAVESFFYKDGEKMDQRFLYQLLEAAKTLLGEPDFVKFLENSPVSAGMLFSS